MTQRLRYDGLGLPVYRCPLCQGMVLTIPEWSNGGAYPNHWKCTHCAQAYMSAIDMQTKSFGYTKALVAPEEWEVDIPGGTK